MWLHFDPEKLNLLQQIIEWMNFSKRISVYSNQRVAINLTPLKSQSSKFWFQGVLVASKRFKFLEQFNNRSNVQWYSCALLRCASVREFFQFLIFGLKVWALTASKYGRYLSTHSFEILITKQKRSSTRFSIIYTYHKRDMNGEKGVN